MQGLAIIGKGIHKAYRSGSTSTSVLRGVDLRIERGECIFLVGPSGSGKSTLLSILGCILAPDGGEIQILGDNVTKLCPRDQARFRRHKIGFVFQRFHLIRGLNAWENVAVAFNLLGTTASTAKKESHHLLDAVGLADKASSHIGQLSMGQRQRVAVARALAGDPELILADEPTAALDAETGAGAINLLKELAIQRGKTVFVVTHDARIFSLADRILRLDNGRIAKMTPDAGNGMAPAREETPHVSSPDLR